MGDMSLSFRLSLTSPCRPRTSLLPPFVRSSFTSFTRPLRSSVTSGPPSLRSVGTTEGSGERLGGKEDDRETEDDRRE